MDEIAISVFQRFWRGPRVTHGAFTLIEMLIVMMLIGLLASTAIVALQGRTRVHGLKASAQDLAEALRYAACQQKRCQRPYRVAFDEGMHSYRVETAAPGTLIDFVAARGLPGRQHALVDGVSIRAVRCSGQERPLPLEAIEFNPDGEVFSGTVEVADATGAVVEVEVMGGTGQVDIH